VEGCAPCVISEANMRRAVTLGLCREQFIVCTQSVARGHVRKKRGKAEVVGDNKAFEVSDRSTLTSLDELKLLAG
jgi:hypothetical protein